MTRPARIKQPPVYVLTSATGMGGGGPLPGLDDLTDVDLTGLADGDSIVWDAGSGTWIPGAGATAGRWELAVITGSPPDPLYADGDFLYIFVP
jgi:hypothetical protein